MVTQTCYGVVSGKLSLQVVTKNVVKIAVITNSQSVYSASDVM